MTIFISTAHKNQYDEQAGTGDIDYARTLAEKLKESYQNTNSSEEVACIQHLHNEDEIYTYIEKTKSKNPILHIMLNPPYTGSAFTVNGLVEFKKRNNCKIVITSIEFAKYSEHLKTEACNYFEIADHIIFLDDNDKEKAKEFSGSRSVDICSASVIPVPATIPEIPGLKPSGERGNNVLFFGMIRKAKGIGYLLELAQLIKDATTTISDNSMRDIKIIIVGSIQEHIYNNIFQLERIMLAMYPEKKEQIEQLINISDGRRYLSEEEIKTIIQKLKKELESYEEQNLPKALPIELYLDVPKDQLAVPFNKCKFSVLPLWRGGSIRNSSMTNMLTHNFITISFSGTATPKMLIDGEYSGAMILLPLISGVEDVFANNVFNTLKNRLDNPELNNTTYERMRHLSNNILSMAIIIQNHIKLYSSLRVNAVQNMPQLADDQFSQETDRQEIELYNKVYTEGKAYQFIKTIRF